MIDTLYLIPTITSDTNGGGYGEFFSITPNKDEIDEYLSKFDYNHPGTTTDDGEYLDDDYFTQTYLDPTQDIIGCSDPYLIDKLINSDTFIYGFSSITIDSDSLIDTHIQYTRADYDNGGFGIEPMVDPDHPRLIELDHPYYGDLPYTYDPIDHTTGTYDLTRDRWYLWTYTCKTPFNEPERVSRPF